MRESLIKKDGKNLESSHEVKKITDSAVAMMENGFDKIRDPQETIEQLWGSLNVHINMMVVDIKEKLEPLRERRKDIDVDSELKIAIALGFLLKHERDVAFKLANNNGLDDHCVMTKHFKILRNRTRKAGESCVKIRQELIGLMMCNYANNDTGAFWSMFVAIGGLGSRKKRNKLISLIDRKKCSRDIDC